MLSSSKVEMCKKIKNADENMVKTVDCTQLIYSIKNSSSDTNVPEKFVACFKMLPSQSVKTSHRLISKHSQSQGYVTVKILLHVS